MISGDLSEGFLDPKQKKRMSRQIEKKSTKDEFDYATDWRRTYVQVYTRLKWLNAYA